MTRTKDRITRSFKSIFEINEGPELIGSSSSRSDLKAPSGTLIGPDLSNSDRSCHSFLSYTIIFGIILALASSIIRHKLSPIAVLGSSFRL